MSLNTYLTFDGNCRQAFEFYRSVFGGEFSELHSFAEGPPPVVGDKFGINWMINHQLPQG